MTGNLDSQVALVTGGSRGIGRAVAVALAARGANVVVNYSSRQDAAEKTAELCRQAGGTAEIVQFSVESAVCAAQAIDAIAASRGRLDILVNNAGISRDGLLVRIKDEDWRQTMAVNLDGAFYCSRAAARVMAKARYGRIINISSVVGQMGNAGQAPYVASKAAMIGLTKSMARELAGRNITVNSVAPGFIATDMTGSLNEKLREEYMKNIPLARFGDPEDVAAVVAFLAGKEAGYVTGQVVGVNGGMYM